MSKDVGKIPGYTLAKDPKKSCETCVAFKEGFCKMFYMPVEANYTCRDWKAK